MTTGRGAGVIEMLMDAAETREVEQATRRRAPWSGWRELALARVSGDMLLAAAYGFYLLAYGWFVLVWRGGIADAGRAALLASIVYLPFEAAVPIVAWLASRRTSLDARSRHAWALLALAYIPTNLVNLGWVYFASIRVEEHFPWWMYAISYARYPLALWAISSFPRAPRRGADRATFALDTAIVLVAGTAVSWHFLLRALLASTDSGLLTAVYTLSYPVLDLVLIFALATILMRRPPRTAERALALLLVSFVVVWVADVAYVRARVLQVPTVGGLLDILYALTGALASAAGWVQWRGARSAPDAGAANRPTLGRAYSLIPYIAMAAVFATLLLESRQLEAGAATSSGQQYSPITALIVAVIVITGIVAWRQITAQQKNSELLTERLNREAHFRALVQHGSDVTLVVDADGTVMEATPSLERVLGHDPQTLVGRSLFALVDYHDVALARADVAQIIAAPDADREAAASPCEWRMRHAERGERWVEVMSTNLLHDPAVRGIVINARDVTERKELEAELRHRAYHDSLTGLANRGRFHTAVTDALSSLRRAVASPGAHTAPRTMLAVIIIDLDDFKPVNDGHGHAAGDQLLRAIGRRLRAAARDADVVARLGGDEFAILLGRVADESEARAIADRVLASVHRPLEVAHERVTVGASIGVACAAVECDDDARDASSGHYLIAAGVDAVDASETMLHAADAAMYAAKSGGGRGVVLARVTIATSAPQRA